MKVTVSVGGKFHAFHLARQLLKRGFLERLITSYPKFEAKKDGIPPSKVRSVLVKEVLERAWGLIPKLLRARFNPRYLTSVLFDALARREVAPSDIFVGWSGFSLLQLRRAKALGAVTIVERGSSHILFQSAILKEEYRRWGLPMPRDPVHPKLVARELREYKEADFISVPSRFVKRTFLEQGVPEGKLIQVPYGVDLSQFRRTPKTDVVFRIVCAGGIGLRKGIPYLLQAFAELKLPNSELLLVGSLSDEIKPILKRFRGAFRHAGHVSQQKLAELFSQSSVFAMMSVEEGLAMVIPQAMACGLPVVATMNTGAEDVVRDGVDGFIIPVRDMERLKEKLAYLYEHPDACAAMGRSAKERVRSGFTWDDYGGRIVAAYERALAARRS
jgi:glycosyltransferase involved in cell wall biosynthesis